MTEHSYIRSVHRRLAKVAPPTFYYWKINDNFEGGVADAYYSDATDCWIEYKYVALPKRPSTVMRFGLSPLQQAWLKARHAQGRNVGVIVGSPGGAAIYPGISWDKDITCAEFSVDLAGIEQVAAYILACTSKP